MRNLIRYNPRGLSLYDDIDRVFRTFVNDEPGLSRSTPSVDIRETDAEFVLEAEVPGLSEKDVEVKVEDNLLTIASRKDEKSEEKREGYVVRERRSAVFSRSFVLPKDVDREKIAATFKDGLLSLQIPKAERVKPRQIEVKKA